MAFTEVRIKKEDLQPRGEPTITLMGGFPCQAVYISLPLARKAKIKGGDVFRVFADQVAKVIKLKRVSSKCREEISCVTATHADSIMTVDGFRRLKIPMKRHFISMKVGYSTPIRVPVDIQDGNQTLIFSYNEKDRICRRKK